MQQPSPLYIPKPCHEDWDKMTPTQKGKFCKVCTKEVVDFTAKKQEEILTYLEHTEGQTCGVFSSVQLNSEMQNRVIQESRPRWKKWVLSTVAVLGMLGWFKESKAQKMGKVAIRGDIAYIEHNTQSDSTIYSGTVYAKSNDNKPVGGATVTCYSNGEQIATTTTIANGTFRLSIPPGEIANNTIILEVSHEYGYDYSTYTVSRQNHRINIYLGEIYKTLGEIAFVPKVVENDTLPVSSDSVITVCTNIIDTTSQNVNTEIDSTSDLTNELTQVDTTRVELNTVEEISNDGISVKIYPNPSNSPFTIETGRSSRFAVNVYSENGQLISSNVFTGYKTSLESDKLTPGTYLVEIIDTATQERAVMRVIKI